MPLRHHACDKNRIHLIARDDSRNLQREYYIERSVDLFGLHVVDWAWGRIGARGLSRRRSFPTQDQAIAFVAALLARRATAPRRIGAAYLDAAGMLGQPAPMGRPLTSASAASENGQAI